LVLKINTKSVETHLTQIWPIILMFVRKPLHLYGCFSQESHVELVFGELARSNWYRGSHK
ncbi:7155_t:CDS:1, partial [Paraglomus occultum]